MGFIDSNTAENLLAHAFGVSQYQYPSSLQVGLLGPGGNELGTTQETSGYARVASNGSEWATSGGDIDDSEGSGVTNTALISWPELTQDEVWVVDFVRVWDSAGNVIGTAKLLKTATFRSTHRPALYPGDAKFYLDFFQENNADCS